VGAADAAAVAGVVAALGVVMYVITLFQGLTCAQAGEVFVGCADVHGGAKCQNQRASGKGGG
jgi:hypothetical protein